MEKILQEKRGITLIALVVTIIVLIILAGISISLVLGDNGIVTKAQEAKKDYSEQAAKEKLELVLADLKIEKISDKTMEDSDVDNALSQQGMAVMGNIVLVDGYQFQIDKSVPEIVASIGKGSVNEEIQIGEVQIDYATSHYVKANLQVAITYEGELSEVTINGKNIVPELQDGAYTINTEVESNGTYAIVAKDKEGNYQIAMTEVTEIAEDMDIYTAEQLKFFRDKVNHGATYENRTIRVMNKIELAGSETEQWTPIGNGETKFKGTFDGRGNSIEGIYINNSLEGQGLFTTLEEGGNIQNIKVQGNITSNNNCIAGLVAYNKGTIRNCHNYIQVQGNSMVGGLVGKNLGMIEECSNHVEVTASDTVGGICSLNYSVIGKCYNVGNIVANRITSGGIVACNGWDGANGYLYNCYNNATVSSNYDWGFTGGVVGSPAPTAVNGYMYNCYTIQNVTINGVIQGSADIQNCYTTEANTKLAELNAGIDKGIRGTDGEDTEQPWVEDTQNINNGYPILSWQLTNNQ